VRRRPSSDLDFTVLSPRAAAIGIAAGYRGSIPRENYKRSIRVRNARRAMAMKQHNHSSDDRLIQYRGKYSRHSRGQALTN
jgi:hypothetical protein